MDNYLLCLYFGYNNKAFKYLFADTLEIIGSYRVKNLYLVDSACIHTFC